MREPLECSKAQHLASRSSRRDPKPSEDEIRRGERGERPDDCDRTDPAQHDLVKVIPDASRRLNEDARAGVELIDLALDARKFAQQRLLIDDVRLRVDRRIRLLGEGGRRESDKAPDHGGGKYQACARQELYHGRSFRHVGRRRVDTPLVSCRAYTVMSSR
jgi:hypothetical protein